MVPVDARIVEDPPDIQWIRHQLDGLVGARSRGGLNAADERRYVALCELEVSLIPWD